MREIKFRIYQNLNAPHEEPDWEVKEYEDIRYEPLCVVEGGLYYHIVQYTGLLDKNGKEIWEGDIASIKSASNWKNIDNSKLEYYVVTFEDGAFTLYGRSHYVTIHSEDGEDGYDRDDSLLYEIDTERAVEVVGNKYQNPELLKLCLHEVP